MVEYGKEYDFLVWTSFPSSIKFWDIRAKVGIAVWSDWTPAIAVAPGNLVKVQVNCKQENVLYSTSRAETWGWVEAEKRWRKVFGLWVDIPRGTIPKFKTFTSEMKVPEDITAIRVRVGGGSGSPEAPGITWFDDLKIYQDDELIYSNDFSNWNPYIGAGVGAVATAIPAWLITRNPLATLGVSVLVGAPLGGLVGYLTAKP